MLEEKGDKYFSTKIFITFLMGQEIFQVQYVNRFVFICLSTMKVKIFSPSKAYEIFNKTCTELYCSGNLFWSSSLKKQVLFLDVIKAHQFAVAILNA